ncbi:uncharacterized protein [Elaeis guineensis]|uniref:Uncharacterized protein LOC105045987 n=1 Tax=Elaeis guineensis var. tenera TaxID=51953 RepID=A0A6I9RAU1_ELAGV|nr:uncharacterized protein LOC105045987 [Elaeis guineensis]
MEKIGVLAAIILVLVVARVPDASSRVLIADGAGGEKPNSGKVPPSPSPNPSPKANASESHQPRSPSTNSTTGDPKTSASSANSAHLPLPSGPENNKNGETSKGSERRTNSRSPMDSPADSCPESSKQCHIAELIACLQHPKKDSKGLLLLVQNTGEDIMTVNIKVTHHIKINDEEIQIPKRNITKISINATEGLEIFLSARSENCTLHTKASDWNLFQDFPAYATHLTPIYGAYFLCVTMVICGGTWACCKFRRGRRVDTRIPYQQLEMGAQTQSSSAVVGSNTADGWDEGWGEDWDEEEAAPQPSEKHTTGSVSANGLTSRSPRKDGWDMDWDD